MKKTMTWIAVSICALFAVSACDIYHNGDCDGWETCDDDWGGDWGGDDDWDDDWDGDWDGDDDGDNYCQFKLECLDDCTEIFGSDGDVIEAVLCYSACFFSYDDCSSDKNTYDDPCDGSYNDCMTGCHQEMGCASGQMDCYLECDSERGECKQDDDGSDDTGDGTSDDTDDGTSDDTAPEISCKDDYDSCVDDCAWDQWICHENCYENYYGCMDTQTSDDEPSADDVCA